MSLILNGWLKYTLAQKRVSTRKWWRDWDGGSGRRERELCWEAGHERALDELMERVSPQTNDRRRPALTSGGRRSGRGLRQCGRPKSRVMEWPAGCQCRGRAACSGISATRHAVANVRHAPPPPDDDERRRQQSMWSSATQTPWGGSLCHGGREVMMMMMVVVVVDWPWWWWWL